MVIPIQTEKISMFGNFPSVKVRVQVEAKAEVHGAE
jgi:hypothetical protein